MQSAVLLFLNLGSGEIAVVILFILMFFGAKKIPELARGLGKGLRELKDAANGIQQEIQKSANAIEKEIDITKEIKKVEKDLFDPK